MIDRSKRKTLKNIGSIAASGVAAAVSANSFASTAVEVNNEAAFSNTDMAQIRVHTRVSVETNDIEVILTNNSDVTAHITELTPAETVTKRGRFNFAELMKQGELRIEAGESVSVPMTPHPVVIDASDVARRSASLNEALKKSMTARSHDNNLKLRVMDATLFA